MHIPVPSFLPAASQFGSPSINIRRKWPRPRARNECNLERRMEIEELSDHVLIRGSFFAPEASFLRFRLLRQAARRVGSRSTDAGKSTKIETRDRSKPQSSASCQQQRARGTHRGRIRQAFRLVSTRRRGRIDSRRRCTGRAPCLPAAAAAAAAGSLAPFNVFKSRRTDY